jgi:TetR/AcrR family transcriptional regulator, regulator of mycofactocin system
MLVPMAESVWAGHKRRTEAAIVAAGLELFTERGFEGTTVDQIAAAAGISRRTFFRYFADKEELFFAEDERLLQVVEDTLDGARPGEPVLDLARRATRALAAQSVADPGRRLARERLIAATPALQARQMAKTLRWERAIAERLEARGSAWPEALLAPKLALACFQAAYQRWVLDPGQDLPALVDDSFAALAGLIDG